MNHLKIKEELNISVVTLMVIYRCLFQGLGTQMAELYLNVTRN